MARIQTEKPANKTLELMRRLAADKRETQRQLREAFARDAELQRIVNELDSQYAKRNA
ncbi:hypothetical protein [Spirosoma gilvum]